VFEATPVGIQAVGVAKRRALVVDGVRPRVIQRQMQAALAEIVDHRPEVQRVIAGEAEAAARIDAAVLRFKRLTHVVGPKEPVTSYAVWVSAKLQAH